MDGLTLLEEARGAGLRVAAEGDRLVIRGPKTAEPVARRLLAHKAEVLAALAGPRQLAPTPDPGAGLSAASLADWSRRGEVVEIASRTLGSTIYVTPDLAAAASLVESGVPRHLIFTASELAELARLFTLDPPQRAAVLRVFDAVRAAFGTDVEVVAVRPAAKQPGSSGDALVGAA
jgi:hypothetical protein